MGQRLRLIVDISGHGLGHLTQIAPVVRALRELVPGLEIVARSAVPRAVLAANLGPLAGIAAPPPDVGLIMTGPHVPDIAATHDAYRAVHADLPQVASTQARDLAALGADALVSDIAYTGLLGADRLGLPSACLCSLHWGEVVSAYLGAGNPDVREIQHEIGATYDLAREFIVPAPRRSVPGIRRQRGVPPLVRTWGRRRPDEIAASCGRPPGTRIALVTFGGLGGTLPEVHVPDWPSWMWIVPQAHQPELGRAAITPIAQLAQFDFLDLVASSDLVVTKTGYGTFMECCHYGVPCVFLSRPDWPESAEIEAWMTTSGHGVSVTLHELQGPGWWHPALSILQTARPSETATGHQIAADRLVDVLELAP
ncbi:MAG: hypothetical protein NW217_01965 [Hyphomicrobiaceae bacterium]|nr:hypothetical protein [Hyphomicrobiaceae bacterium]